MPWASAAEQKVYFRRGQLAMLVAAPGVGKSVIASAYAVQSGVRCLYLSCDTDAYTTSVRLVSAVTGCTLEVAEAGVSNESDWAMEALAQTQPNLRYGFTSSPDEREIADRLKAYREGEGDSPELVVIDNLGNVAFDDEEFTGLRRLMRELQAMAGKTGSSVLVLHHATGEHEDGNDAIPLRGVSGKLSKFPYLILTAYQDGYHTTKVSVVKHRFGPADPTGRGIQFELQTDLEKVQVSAKYLAGVQNVDH